MLVFVASCLVRLALLAVLRPFYQPENSEISRIAVTFAEQGVFGNPYVVATGPTAHTTPLYPLGLGYLFRWFGSGTEGQTVQFLFNIICAALQFALIPLLAVTLQVPVRYGVIGGLAGGLLPVSFLTEIRAAEVLAGVCVAVVSIATIRTWTDPAGLTVRRGCWHGALWGLALLASSSALPMLAGCLATALFVPGLRQRGLGRYALGVVLTAALTLLPWAARNRRVLGSWVLLRSNLGLELHVSNNAEATPLLDTNIKGPGYRRYHPSVNAEQAAAVRELGEIEFNHRRRQEALDWIRREPVAFLRLTALRAAAFWFPPTSRPYQAPLFWVTTLGGCYGLWLIWRSHHLAAAFLAGLWIAFPLPYYLVQSSVRYRYPMQWSILLLLGVAVGVLWERFAEPLAALRRRRTAWLHSS